MSKKVLVVVLIAVLVVGAVATYFAKPDLFKGSLFSVGAEQCKTYQKQWKAFKAKKDIKKMQVYANLYKQNNCESVLSEEIDGTAVNSQAERGPERSVTGHAEPNSGPAEPVSLPISR